MIQRMKRGDTIVEVLLALAILAAVMAGAYVTTNKALKTGRDAQERSEALQLAEGQLELLKSLRTIPNALANPIAPDGPAAFCLYTDATVVTGDNRKLQAITSLSDPAGYPAVCKSDYYNISIERTGSAGDYLFTARVLWESILGTTSSVVNGTNLPGYSEVKLYYRVQE